MYFNKLPTLEHIALVKTGSLLCMQCYNRDLTKQLDSEPSDPNVIQSKLLLLKTMTCKDIQSLQITKCLKNKLIDVITAIGLEVEIWRQSHAIFSSDKTFFFKSLQNLCWTPHGTVDKKETSKLLVGDDSIDVAKRFELACIYCLESDVRMLWGKLPQNKMELFNNIKPEHFQKFNQCVLVKLWTCEVVGQLGKLNSVMRLLCHNRTAYRFGFEFSWRGGNKAGAEYFIKKLSKIEKRETLVRDACYVARMRCSRNEKCQIAYPKEYASVLRFLLSEMNEDQMIEVLGHSPYSVLVCFLDWPWQNLFLETAKLAWTFLSVIDYLSLLYLILHNKVVKGSTDYDYQTLFREFWRQAPIQHKKYAIQRCSLKGEWNMFSDLLLMRDRESILLILNDCSIVERERLAFEDSYWRNVICSHELDMLMFFLQRSLSSKAAMIKYKEEVEGIVCRSKVLQRRKSLWDQFFKLLDTSIERTGGECPPAKRLCV